MHLPIRCSATIKTNCMYKYIIITACLLVGCKNAPVSEEQNTDSTQQLPNVILIIGDDQGYPYFGFMGADYVQTPNMDKLANSGTLFTQGYVPANHCRPSLQSLMTGTLPVEYALNKDEIKTEEQSKENYTQLTDAEKDKWNTDYNFHCMKYFTTLPKLLKEKGYVSFQGGANIPIPSGDYIISFNSASGEYNFQEVVEYGTVGLIGKSSPFGDWDNETPLVKDANDFNVWTLDAVSLTTKDPTANDEGVKFRADNDWAVNWGADAFPGGVGTQDGPNIPTEEGTYAVSFISSNGEYAFSPVSSTEEILSPDEISVYPNPTSNLLYVEMDIEEMKGSVKFSVIDVSGKILMHKIQNTSNLEPIDVAGLPDGNFVLQISNQDYLITKRFSIYK